MTQVDFYILPATSIEQRHQFACRLVEKAYKNNHKVYLHGNDLEHTHTLDHLLWSFRASSFIPHQLESENQTMEGSPVIIGADNAPNGFIDIMINLSNQVPSFFSRFERVIEIVTQEPEVTQSTRESYRFYRDRGYPLNTHDMRKT